MDIDLAAELGAEQRVSAQRLTLYLPNKDKVGNDVPNHANWVKEARELASLIGGGATAFPPSDGTWVADDGTLIWEETRIVYTFVYLDRLVKQIARLREFLHRFGRDTSQGEVVVEFDGELYRIKEFDPPTGG